MRQVLMATDATFMQWSQGIDEDVVVLVGAVVLRFEDDVEVNVAGLVGAVVCNTVVVELLMVRFFTLV